MLGLSDKSQRDRRKMGLGICVLLKLPGDSAVYLGLRATGQMLGGLKLFSHTEPPSQGSLV